MAMAAVSPHKLFTLRDLLANDTLALKKWPQVVDHLAIKPADVLRIKKMLEGGDFEEAVLQSLQAWRSRGAPRPDLALVLKVQGLDALVDKLQEAEYAFLLEEINLDSSHSNETGTWFEVGHVVLNFTGRQQETEAVHARLDGSHSLTRESIVTVTISGLGGIGKSTLARKYAFTYRNFYDENVLWINAETVDSMRASFIRLSQALGLNLGHQPPQELLVGRVFEQFQKKCLFIYDNVENLVDLKQFLPKGLSPQHEIPYVLVTSRRADLNPLPLNEIRLDVLEIEEAVELIQKLLPKATWENAVKLANKLQRLPLALQQALAFIRDQHFDDDSAILEYLKQFDKSEAELLSDVRFRDHNDYSSTTFATWEITLTRIRKMTDGELAIEVINSLAYLNPDSISVNFVRAVFEDEAEARRGLRLLERFSMVRVSDGKVAIHRVVQHVVRLSFCEREEEVLQKLAEAIRRELKKEGLKLRDAKRECTSHGLHLLPFQMSHENSEAVTANCYYFNDLCYFSNQYGNYDEALSASQQMAALYESVKGEEHESTIRMKWRMADAYSYMGKYSDSVPIVNSILPVAKSTLGSEHQVTMNIQSSLADDLNETGDSEKAVQIYNEMIPVAECVFGDNDGNVLVYKANKARALRRLRKYDEALELLQHVVQKRNTLHGEDDVRTLGVKNRIAFVHYDKREFSKALRIWEEVEVGYRNTLGDTHPHTVSVRKNISICQEELTRPERSNCQML